MAYFPQDLIGDSLVWANQIEAFSKVLSFTKHQPSEVTIFCTKGVAELFECMTFCDHVVTYDPSVSWKAEESAAFGHFDLVVNTRYDADSVARIEALDHDEACGFENVDIPESVCKHVYRRYIPLSRWDDYRLRRETSVTEQGAELVRLYDPHYHCSFVSFDKTDFVRVPPSGSGGVARIVFVVGASYAEKTWGMERFFEVARHVRACGYTPFFLLGPSERDREMSVQESGFAFGSCLPFCKVAGYLDPDYGTACVVGNDTGLMHLACALGAPSITIMPFGSEFVWFPYAEDNRASHICINPGCAASMCVTECRERLSCVDKISVEEVKRAVSILLSCEYGFHAFDSAFPYLTGDRPRPRSILHLNTEAIP